MKPVRTHIRAYQTVSEKQTGIPAGLLPARAIYAWNERLQPPDCRFNAYVCSSHTLN